MCQIIVALDFNNPETAIDFAEKVKSELDWVKVGLELFIRSGPGIVRDLKEMGLSVFLDLKLLDIPNTVSGAVSGCIAAGADMLTLHILGGKKMMQEAIKARDELQAGSDDPAKLLGVTILTSMDSESLPWPDTRQPGEIVRSMAIQGANWGLDGCVCSGLEVAAVKQRVSGNFLAVTPGIRIEPGDDDQKRVATPEYARNAGSDFLVIGRPITRNRDPLKAVRDIRSRLI